MVLLFEEFADFWPYVLTVLHVLIGVPTAAHAVLSNREVRSSIGWVGLIWLAPLVGSILYIFFGVNRIQRKAQRLRADLWEPQQPHTERVTRDETVAQIWEAGNGHLTTLIELTGNITGRPLLGGNQIEPLVNGDLAFPAMLAAIEQAKESIALSTYIFDNDEAGEMFVNALAAAHRRGVEVRVLIDGVGARYSHPSIFTRLRQNEIRAAAFLPAFVPTLLRFGNLRSHRKIMVVDGRIGFTGGMNIRIGNMIGRQPAHPVQDMHFRLEGPVVAQLQEEFAIDWSFATDESLEGMLWFPPLDPVGNTAARGIADGPDDDFDQVRLAFLGALSCARKSAIIVTPYFLPETAVIDALNVAAMRGVEVDIVLPSVNNLFFMQWATAATIGPVLERGCRVWLTPPPFDHTKLMLVDGIWVCFGSTNWDTRSFRLNFEFNVECYDRDLAAKLLEIAHHKIREANRLTLEDINGRSLPVKLRDGVARLFLPYL